MLSKISGKFGKQELDPFEKKIQQQEKKQVQSLKLSEEDRYTWRLKVQNLQSEQKKLRKQTFQKIDSIQKQRNDEQIKIYDRIKNLDNQNRIRMSEIKMNNEEIARIKNATIIQQKAINKLKTQFMNQKRICDERYKQSVGRLRQLGLKIEVGLNEMTQVVKQVEGRQNKIKDENQLSLLNIDAKIKQLGNKMKYEKDIVSNLDKQVKNKYQSMQTRNKNTENQLAVINKKIEIAMTLTKEDFLSLNKEQQKFSEMLKNAIDRGAKLDTQFVLFKQKFEKMQSSYEMQKEQTKLGMLTLGQASNKLKQYAKSFDKMQSIQDRIIQEQSKHMTEMRNISQWIQQMRVWMTNFRQKTKQTIQNTRKAVDQQISSMDEKMNNIRDENRKKYRELLDFGDSVQRSISQKLSTMNKRYEDLLFEVNEIGKQVVKNRFDQQMQNPIFRYNIWSGSAKKPDFEKFSVLDLLNYDEKGNRIS